jgi:hypothetical protein
VYETILGESKPECPCTSLLMDKLGEFYALPTICETFYDKVIEALSIKSKQEVRLLG